MASPVVFQPSQNGLNRRSLSIFSRRGAETPTPKTQALAAVSMPFSTVSSTGAQPPRSKKWKLGNRGEKKPQGTILRMVPKEQPMPGRIMSRTEFDVAITPNEEILRNIGHVATATTSPTSTTSTRPTVEFAHILNQMMPSRAGRKDSQGEVVGVWKNGCTEWDSKMLKPTRYEEVPRPKTSDGASSSDSLTGEKPQRPNIRLIIPNGDSTRRPLQMFSKSASGANYSRNVSTSHMESIRRAELSSSPRSSAMQLPAVTFAPKPNRVNNMPTNPAAIMEQSIIPPEVPQQKSSDRLHVHFRMLSANSSSDSSSVHSSDNECSSKVNSSRTSLMSIALEEKKADSPKPDLEEKIVPVILDPELRSSYAASISASTRSPVTLSDPPLGSKESPAELEGTPIEGPRLENLLQIMRRESINSTKRRMSSRRGTRRLSRKISADELLAAARKSPSLSQAERELETQLDVISDSMTAAKDSQESKESPTELVTVVLQSVMTAPPPPIPPKSTERRYPPPASTQIKKWTPYRVNKPLPPIPRKSSRRVSIAKPLSFISEEQERKITAKRAETVVFKILNDLNTLDDLFNAALANKGFYWVFKRNELRLMRSTLKKMDPAAWEYRETCLNDDMSDQQPETPKTPLDYTPTTYYQTYTRDFYIIGALKTIILEQCQSFLRDETVRALKVQEPLQSSRVDCALWRVWTFCRIFGCNRGREDDIVAQMDWLRGGKLAHQDTCTSTIATSDSFSLSGVLLNAPDHFGKGNGYGLSADELYDITEMWNCLNHITQSVLGRTAEARQYGVFDSTEVRGGDIDGEESMLEEWHSYLLSLGLGTVLPLAVHSSPDDPSIFILSKQNGWSNWTPPAFGGSRSTFLKEAVARLYEEKICETFASVSYQNEEVKQQRRTRGKTFAAEIKQRRKQGGSVRSERPMSGWEDVLAKLAEPASNSLQVPAASLPPRRVPLDLALVRPLSGQTMSRSSYSSHASLDQPAAPTTPPPPRRSSRRPVAGPAPRPLSRSHSRHSSGSSAGGAAATQQHPRQLEMADPQAPNSVDRAVFRIVEMGFSPEEAKIALRETDRGDRLRVDHAVEYLLRKADGFLPLGSDGLPACAEELLPFVNGDVTPCADCVPFAVSEGSSDAESVSVKLGEISPGFEGEPLEIGEVKQIHGRSWLADP